MRFSSTGRPERKSAQKRLERAVVEVPERLRRRRRTRAASVTSKSASPAWVAKPPNRSGRSIAQTIAPNPPDDFPASPRCARLGQRPEARVDERRRRRRRGSVPYVADRRRVDPLRAAERGEAVDSDDDRVEPERVELLREATA